MKCDELKEVMNVMQVSGERIPSGYYKKSDVDAAIAELKAKLSEKDREIALLKERICNGDVSRLTWIDDCIAKDKEIAELKEKLEDVQASAYTDSVDAGMRERRLKRALWLERARRALTEQCYENYSFYINRHQKTMYGRTYRPYIAWLEKWNEVERTCLKKAEEYR